MSKNLGIMITIVFLGMSNTLKAQDFFISDNVGNLGKVDLATCTYKKIPLKINQPFIGDITFHPNGKLYGVTNSSFFTLDTLPNSTATLISSVVPSSSSLTSDNNGIIYGAGSQYWSYNPSTQAIKNYGYMVAEGDTVRAAGDLTFYNGDLYVASRKNKLVKINLQDPSNCTTYMSFSPQDTILGIVSFKGCDGTKTYAIKYGDNSSDILEIDWQNKKTKFVCTVPVAIYGAASRFEFLASKPDTTTIEQFTCDSSKAKVTTQRLKNVLNCDSLVTTKIVFGGSTPTFTTFNTCETNKAKTDTVRLINFRGCDSLIIRTGILKDDTTTISQTICQGDSLYFGNQFYKKNGSYYFGFKRTLRCDSVVNLKLVINLPPNQVTNYWVCEAKDVKSDTGKKKFLTICDTAFITNYRLAPRIQDLKSVDKSICFGDKFAWDNKIIDQTGSYKAVFKNKYGCDSTVTLNLTKLPKDSLFQEKPTCNPNKVGNVKAVLKNQKGCDSIVLTKYFLRSEINFNQKKSICEGMFFQVGDTTYKSSGIYVKKIKTTEGCDSIITTDLTVVSLNLTMPQDTILNLGDSVQLNPISRSNVPVLWQWSPKTYLSCDTCGSTWSNPLSPTYYRLVMYDPLSKCRKEGNTYVRVKSECPTFIPNAFSPNDDGVNDVLKVYLSKCVKRVKRFAVFNRWGNQIVLTDNVPQDTEREIEIWDGLINGKFAPNETYVYYVEVEYINGTVDILKGDVSLIR